MRSTSFPSLPCARSSLLPSSAIRAPIQITLLIYSQLPQQAATALISSKYLFLAELPPVFPHPAATRRQAPRRGLSSPGGGGHSRRTPQGTHGSSRSVRPPACSRSQKTSSYSFLPWLHLSKHNLLAKAPDEPRPTSHCSVPSHRAADAADFTWELLRSCGRSPEAPMPFTSFLFSTNKLAPCFYFKN